MGRQRRKSGERHISRSPLRTLQNRLRRNRDLVKCYLLFTLLVILGFSLVTTPLGQKICLEPSNFLTADCSALCLRVIGMNAYSEGTLLQSGLGSVDIKEGCNGIYATILFLAGVLAFPTNWRNKLIGVLFGTVAIFIINLIRVMTLLYLSIYHPTLFHEAHQYIWQFAIILIGGGLWVLWYDKIVSSARRAPAG